MKCIVLSPWTVWRNTALFFGMLCLIACQCVASFAQSHASHHVYDSIRRFDEALRQGDQLLTAALHTGDSARIAGIYQRKGFIEYQSKDVSSAIRDELRSFGMAERNKYPTIAKRSASILNLAYTFLGDYGKALTYGLRALELCEHEGNKEEVAHRLTSIGRIYYEIDNFERAGDYFRQALQIEKKIKSNRELDLLLLDLSLCYAHARDFIMAKKIMEESLQACTGNCSEKFLAAQQFVQGYILFQSGNMPKSKPYFERSYDFSKKIDDEQHQLENLVYLSDISIASDNIAEAKRYLSAADKFVGRGYHKVEMQLFQAYSNLYATLGDFKNKAASMEKYGALRDSIYGLTMTQQMLTVQAEFEQRGNKDKIKAQNTVLKLQDDAINKQRSLMIAAIAPGVLLLAIALLVYRQAQQKRNANHRLEERIQERSRELERDFTTLQQRNDQQRNLMTKTVRDLKSHLSTLHGLSTLMAGSTAEDKNHKRMTILAEAGQRLSDIVNTFLKNRLS